MSFLCPTVSVSSAVLCSAHDPLSGHQTTGAASCICVVQPTGAGTTAGVQGNQKTAAGAAGQARCPHSEDSWRLQHILQHRCCWEPLMAHGELDWQGVWCPTPGGLATTQRRQSSPAEYTSKKFEGAAPEVKPGTGWRRPGSRPWSSRRPPHSSHTRSWGPRRLRGSTGRGLPGRGCAWMASSTAGDPQQRPVPEAQHPRCAPLPRASAAAPEIAPVPGVRECSVARSAGPKAARMSDHWLSAVISPSRQQRPTSASAHTRALVSAASASQARSSL